MAQQLNVGDIQVISVDDKSMFVHGKGKALIQTVAGLKPLVARLTLDQNTKTVMVRVAAADLAGLPNPTGIVVVIDPIEGWGGSTSVTVLG